jgi:hypothetical protein
MSVVMARDGFGIGITVRNVRLDEFEFENSLALSLVTIGFEGAELEVLHGAKGRKRSRLLV